MTALIEQHDTLHSTRCSTRKHSHGMAVRRFVLLVEHDLVLREVAVGKGVLVAVGLPDRQRVVEEEAVGLRLAHGVAVLVVLQDVDHATPSLVRWVVADLWRSGNKRMAHGVKASTTAQASGGRTSRLSP